MVFQGENIRIGACGIRQSGRELALFPNADFIRAQEDSSQVCVRGFLFLL